jgi:SAM-dependent methyltransferase
MRWSHRGLDTDYQRDYWDQRVNARRYDHPVIEFYANQRLDWVARAIPLSRIGSAFEVGCGDGFATYYVDQRVPVVEGGDLSDAMLERNPLPAERLRVIDAEHLPLADGSYDLVYEWEVLHHVEHPDRAVREMARVAREYVVIFEPNRANPLQFAFGLLNEEERGTLRSSKRHLERLALGAGLEIVASEYVGKITSNKTPASLLPLIERLPFRSHALTGISVGIVARKR